MDGWIKTYRKLVKWEWYKDSAMVHLFIHLLITANYREEKWRGILIKRGQLITSRKMLSNQTGISEQSIRTCLERLKSTNEITIKSTNRNSIITVCNYDNYQCMENEANQQNNQPKLQQSTSNQPTIIQEGKEYKKNIKEKFDLSDEFADIVEEWFEYKKDRRESYKSEKAERAFASKLKSLSNNNPSIAKKIIEQSMANNWAGIFDLKTNRNNEEQQTATRKSYKKF